MRLMSPWQDYLWPVKYSSIPIELNSLRIIISQVSTQNTVQLSIEQDTVGAFICTPIFKPWRVKLYLHANHVPRLHACTLARLHACTPRHALPRRKTGAPLRGNRNPGGSRSYLFYYWREWQQPMYPSKGVHPNAVRYSRRGCHLLALTYLDIICSDCHVPRAWPFGSMSWYGACTSRARERKTRKTWDERRETAKKNIIGE